MIAIGVPNFISIGDARVGDLIFPARDPGELGLVIATHNGHRAIGWLRSAELLGVFSFMVPEENCFSFGADWVLEIDPSKGFDSNINVAGVLLLGPNGAEFQFRGGKGNKGETIHFNFAGASSSAGNLMAVNTWRIWPSREARERAEANPLHQIGPSAI